jgi:ribosomal protein S18 acetylase RimI-like enzyme
MPGVNVRRFRPDDAGATVPILYESSGGMYDRYAGTRELAERLLRRALERPGTAASAEVVWVAELDGEIAGAMAAMPWGDWTKRANALFRLSLRTIPPRRWGGALRIHTAGDRSTAEPAGRAFYVDSLATAEPFRRRGVATALLEEAERVARERGLAAVTLDTWAENEPGRALYAARGFREIGRTPGTRGLPAGISLLKAVG